MGIKNSRNGNNQYAWSWQKQREKISLLGVRTNVELVIIFLSTEIASFSEFIQYCWKVKFTYEAVVSAAYCLFFCDYFMSKVSNPFTLLKYRHRVLFPFWSTISSRFYFALLVYRLGVCECAIRFRNTVEVDSCFFMLPITGIQTLFLRVATPKMNQ